MELVIKSSAVEWIEHSYAFSLFEGGYKVFPAYVKLSKCDVLNQIQKCLDENKLPSSLKVTGKKKLNFKIACYQDDGFWFRQIAPVDGKVWRIFVPSKDLLTGKKVIKNVT